MKIRLYIYILILFVFTAGAFAEMKVVDAPQKTPASAEAEVDELPPMTEEELKADQARFDAIELPAKDTPEYWVIRSKAVEELTPLLTQKRAEMKQDRQLLADYLLQIGKGEEMASQNIEVPDDWRLYAEALGFDEDLKAMDLEVPKELPTWEEMVDFGMRFIVDEGFVPMQFDGAEDLASYIELTKRKEQYAQKVRTEMRGYVKDVLEMWIYLGNINQQAACTKWAVQMQLEAETAKSTQKSMLADERRMAALDRQESTKQRKFEDAEARASFRSTRRQRDYQSRENLLRYQQTLLAERYTRSYRW